MSSSCLGLAFAVGCGDEITTAPPVESGNGGAQVGAGGAAGQGGACNQEECDGADNDCDGVVDEDCACVNGDTQPCYSGPAGTEDVGACMGGTQTCDLDGRWGPCAGEVVPDEEICDTFDNDCNGMTDEGFATVTCGLGICQVTVEECLDGEPQSCVPGTPNPSETCDGTDDDCDGQVDEGCSCVDGQVQPCYTGSPQTQNVGECHDGQQTCANGQWGTCTGDATPTPEVCDGLDNDCDGTDDDGDPDGGMLCNTGLPGVCDPGVEHCVSAQIVCVQNVQPSAELCNMLDDDCNPSTPDGAADPSVGVPCDGADSDLCNEGNSTCNNGTIGCSDTTGNTLDLCNNLDDDCNPGTADGVHDPQNGTACDGPDSDLCNEGTRSCSGGVLVCSDNTTSDLDVCDGLNNDCDSASADGSEDPQNGAACDGPDSDLCNEGTRSCSGGVLVCSDTSSNTLDVCNGTNDDCDLSSPDGSEDPQLGTACDGPDSDLCNEGTRSCSGGVLVCSDTTASNLDVCDGVNNDCDPASPDGSEDPQNGTACDGSDGDLCAEGTRSCSGGVLVCSDTSGTNPEVCNALDDDCDGLFDEGNPGGGMSCSVPGQQGVCAQGVTNCSSGVLVCTQVNNPVSEAPTINCSNGLDDDCDGTTDATDTNCCPHDMCVQGGPLDPVCAGAQPNCINTVCTNDPFCCTQAWDGFCISEINTECFSTQCSSCAHNLCVTGGPLTAGCDGGWCVGNVCAADPFCCSTGWDSLCVSAVSTECAPAGC